MPNTLSMNDTLSWAFVFVNLNADETWSVSEADGCFKTHHQQSMLSRAGALPRARHPNAGAGMCEIVVHVGTHGGNKLPKSSYTATISSSSLARDTPVTALALCPLLRARSKPGPPRDLTRFFASSMLAAQFRPPENICTRGEEGGTRSHHHHLTCTQ